MELFVAVLGASSYTYAEATATQSGPDWIASHERTFQYFGGVPGAVVPDQLKSSVLSSILGLTEEALRQLAGESAI